MPFTSDLLGKFSANPLAIDIFAANLLLATMATQLTVIYGSRKDLVTPRPRSRRGRRGTALPTASSSSPCQSSWPG
jgi:hypothetical protein